MADDALLPDLPSLPWVPEGSSESKGLRPVEFYVNAADPMVSVRVASWAGESQPKAADLERLWTTIARKLRVVVLVVLRNEGNRQVADVVGGRSKNSGQQGFPKPIIQRGQSLADVRALCRGVLTEAGHHSAGTFVARWLDDRATDLPGLKNDGLFARHTLIRRVPHRADWPDAQESAKRIREGMGRGLVEDLGFTIKATEDPRATVLVGQHGQRAVALFLDEGEGFDDPSDALAKRTPVSHALGVARQLNVPWIVLTRGRSIRLHPVSPDRGVGRRGRSTTYAEIDLRLLPEDHSGYLWLLFSANALDHNGSADQILADSSRYAADLGVRLRDRIYVDVVPRLATLIAKRMRELGEADDSSDRWLEDAYRNTMVVLFRTLFIAYAEDRGLLPYERNERYTAHSLKKLAQELDTSAEAGVPFDEHDHSLWHALTWTWTTVAKGNKEAGVPEYGGGLFEERTFLDKSLLTRPLSNTELGPILTDLLLDSDEDGELGPVDFRSLSVREFGTIYEGLLESEVSIAAQDLWVDRDKNFVAATPSASRSKRKLDERAPDVPEGEIYFHNRSGARKSSGTYFTKPFVVEYLLDQALEPAMEAHLERVRGDLADGDSAAAGRRFFDFRVADIAMGSGHFLIAAIDRIEARFSDFLSQNDVPEVRRELDRLSSAARSGLDGTDDAALIEDASLLRRQIARRCIYGVDVNSVAVELARLAVWIHTFVPGLPMSYLNHTLIEGNSLTGVGTLEEAEEIVLDPLSGKASFAALGVREALESALPALERLRAVSEATVKDVRAAAAADKEAREAVQPLSQLLDLLALQRAALGDVVLLDVEPKTVAVIRGERQVEEILSELDPIHFPTAFPEVFLRERAGFDCLLGNPPWDKIRPEEQQFWVTRRPGLNALSDAEREREITRLRKTLPEQAALEERENASRKNLQQLFQAAYRYKGSGHYDLAKAFAERTLELAAKGGFLGLVLPRQALVLGGWQELREQWVSKGSLHAVQARNKAGWLFDEVHHSFIVALASWASGKDPGAVVLPEVTGRAGLRASESMALTLTHSELAELSPALAIPWFRSAEEASLFARLKGNPRLKTHDGWVSGSSESTRWDFSGSGRHKDLAGNEPTDGSWRVLMARHVEAFRLVEGVGFQRFISHPEELSKLGRGVELVESGPRLSTDHPLIVFRYPSRNDDTRTVIAAGLPARGYLPSTGYVHTLTLENAAMPEALALLGYLNSLVCDWWARRLVDRHVTAPVVNGLPLPAWNELQIAQAARFTQELLTRGGQVDLPGGLPVGADWGLSGLSDDEVLVGLDLLVAEGFHLRRSDVQAVLEDFTPKAYPEPRRRLLLDGIES